MLVLPLIEVCVCTCIHTTEIVSSGRGAEWSGWYARQRERGALAATLQPCQLSSLSRRSMYTHSPGGACIHTLQAEHTCVCVCALQVEDDLFDMFATATARSRALLEQQSPAQLAAVKAAMADAVLTPPQHPLSAPRQCTPSVHTLSAP